jgi:hypothetical protein
MKEPSLRRLYLDRPPVLTFAPLAWLKLLDFCHSGDTEVGGFGISSATDFLYIQDFVTVRQQVTPVTVRFDDAAVADYFDACVDQGLSLSRCGRIWLHTHPGASVMPSGTDEDTFARVFGACDWAVMFILGRTGRTYARLAFSAGPGGQLLLPVEVDWAAWPDVLSEKYGPLEAHRDQWRQEYAANIQVLLPDLRAAPRALPAAGLPADDRWWGREPWWLDAEDDLNSLIQEELTHERVCNSPDVGPGPAPARDRAAGAPG